MFAGVYSQVGETGCPRGTQKLIHNNRKEVAFVAQVQGWVNVMVEARGNSLGTNFVSEKGSRVTAEREKRSSSSGGLMKKKDMKQWSRGARVRGLGNDGRIAC